VLAGSTLSTDVPTGGVSDRLGDVRASLEASRLGMLVVLNADGIVLGRLDRKALEAGDDAGVDGLMREGPTTVRPSEDLESLLERMRHAGVDAMLVTRSDGRLLGLLERPHAERTAETHHAHH
jgi:CBS domain-containing protein